jgi:hypothetical protein
MTDESSMQEESRSNSPNTIAAPAPTAWPMVLAAAITMVFAGLVTNGYLSLVGGVLIVFAAVGWHRTPSSTLPRGVWNGCALGRKATVSAFPPK